MSQLPIPFLYGFKGCGDFMFVSQELIDHNINNISKIIRYSIEDEYDSSLFILRTDNERNKKKDKTERNILYIGIKLMENTESKTQVFNMKTGHTLRELFNKYHAEYKDKKYKFAGSLKSVDYNNYIGKIDIQMMIINHYNLGVKLSTIINMLKKKYNHELN